MKWMLLVLAGVLVFGCLQSPPQSASPTPETPVPPTPFIEPSLSPTQTPVPSDFVSRRFETRSDGAVRVTNPPGKQSDQNPAFLDENHVLFTRFADGYNQGKAKLVLMDLRDGSETVVVNDGGTAVSTNGNPFTPDKNQVCYASDAKSEDDIWCVPVLGGTPTRVTRDESGKHFIEPSVRFDGQRIAFEMHGPGDIDASRGQIWTTDFSGNTRVLLADDADNRLPQYHPTENKILVQRKENGLFRLFVLDEATGLLAEVGILTDEGTDASWTKKGGIVYSGESARLAVPQIFILEDDQSTRITDSAMLDSAPAASTKQVAFESRERKNMPSRIWIKTLPVERAPRPPPTDYTIAKGASFSWQLVEPMNTKIQADVYDIDLFESNASTVQQLHDQGRKVVCYLSAGTWEPYRPDAGAFPLEAIGRTYAPPFDDEKWLDIRDERVQDIMEKRLDLCKQKGFDGVEPDNVDGFQQKTGFDLTAKDQLAYNAWLAKQAHARGLSVGLKNDGEQAADLVNEFDFALVEQCVSDGFCEEFKPFVDAGKAVFMVEYTDQGTTLDEICFSAEQFGYFGLLKNRNLDAFEATCPKAG
ncbi:endo alpha-1,4 polygalactosaminidase [Candidatus Micrarchaeota archaeon]|nr:endo alpha-1,4 polygalactosaminidase [Candidatus Micrarchaeota archaeon]